MAAQAATASRSASRRALPLAVANLAAPGVVFALALMLYARTLAPGLTWAHAGADGGDFLAAALSGGVPHPTGYPTYLILLRAAIALHPANPALAGNALSAACAALAAALLADLARRVTARLLAPAQGWHAAAAAVAGVAWAASPAVWAQATITEVYALNALAAVLLLWLTWRGLESPRRARVLFPVAGLVAGLGLGNHVTLGLLFPGIAAWVAADRHAGARSPAPRPQPVRVALSFVAAFLLGLAVYAYVPLMAGRNPPVNWGAASTPGNFLWLVTGRLYGPLVLGIGPGDWLPRTVAFLREAGEQFGGPWGIVLALAGLWLIQRRLLPFWLGSLLMVLACGLHAITYAARDSLVNLLPAWALVAIWLAVALGWTIGQVAGKMGGRASRAFVPAVLLAAALALLPGAALARHWDANDLSRDREAEDRMQAMLDAAAPDAVVLTATDGPTFALWYARYGLGRRTDVVPLNVNLVAYDWHRQTLAAWHGEALAGVDLTSTPAAWIRQLAAVRPVYRAEELNLATGLPEEPAGVLVRLLPIR